MRLLLTMLIGIFLMCSTTFAQKAFLSGKVIDSESKSGLPGVQVIDNQGNGTLTDSVGKFSFNVKAGSIRITFKLFGYQTKNVPITIEEGKVMELDVQLSEQNEELETVVVSAGKYEQKLEDITVSMEVVDQELVENKGTTNAEQIVDQVPGVQVNDGQVSIRGGSGFAYGAGSRVLLMIDGLPYLSPDANDIKWNSLPIENVGQIEITKGASSVLYGSSALNGVVHFRTAYPKDEPKTKVNLYHGVYDNPKNKDWIWWDENPYYLGGNFFHSRKVNDNLDLVVAGNALSDQGYREGAFENTGRFNFTTRYRSKKVKGLSYQLNANFNAQKAGLFLIWDSDTTALQPFGGPDPLTDSASSITLAKGTRLTVDPSITYFTKNGGRHELKNRWFMVRNNNSGNQSSFSDLIYSEYQYQKRLDSIDLIVTSGMVYNYTTVRSDLYGDHFGNNMAFYTQLDKKWGKFNLSAGFRGEYFRIDTSEVVSGSTNLPIQPVFRTGMTYKPLEYTILRASWGQGFRFPSIAEKYVRTTVGALSLFPNDSLQPEKGWNAEIGIKQGVSLGKWKGYVDVAGFWTEYENMMEFAFGLFTPEGVVPSTNPNSPDYILNYIGFQAQNAENARITGVDFSIMGTGKLFGNLEATIFAGYTYMNPVTLNADTSYLNTFSDNTDILKYRFNHLFKGDLQLDYKKLSFGISARYNSFVENVDKTFEELQVNLGTVTLNFGDYILPGLPEYRDENDHGNLIFDTRLSYQLNESSRFALIVNNVFNREAMGRPGDILPPRTFLVQYSLNF